VTGLQAVRWISLPTFVDPRGSLTAFEANNDVPFPINRVFYVYNVQPPFERGGHAHLNAEQVLVCVAGSMKIDLSDPSSTETYTLEDPSRGLYVPNMVWTRLYAFTPTTVCLAGASDLYDNNEVIRDWDRYVGLATRKVSASSATR